MSARTLLVPVFFLFVTTLVPTSIALASGPVWGSTTIHADEIQIYTPDLAKHWIGGTADNPSVLLGVWNQDDFTTTASTTGSLWLRWNGVYGEQFSFKLRTSAGGDPFYSGATTLEDIIATAGGYYRFYANATTSLQEYLVPANSGLTIHRGDELWGLLISSDSGYGANHWVGGSGTLPFLQLCDGGCAYAAPSIVLLGDATTTIALNSTFSDPGATAQDVLDGNLTSAIQVTGSVNTSVVGTTTLTYSVTNSHGLTTTTTRTVVVICGSGCVSSALFLPGTETSRLYYKDILGIEHQIWEPDLFTDIPFLAMNSDGTSKYDVYTKDKDIIDSMYGNNPVEKAVVMQALGSAGAEVYGDFENSLNSLVASTTFGMKEWRAYPYDWRYDVRDVITNGTKTKESDGSFKTVYLEDVLKEMASSSPTGKVTVIGHSNGGLLAKALGSALGTSAPTYIDRIILIGTPQWGTPSAIGALLHGDNFSDLPSLVINPVTARLVEGAMGDPYDLLPSTAYFSNITSPVATFEPAGSLSGSFATSFGNALASFSSLLDFLTDSANLNSSVGDSNDLHAPPLLHNDLITKAVATHAVLDNWTPPAGITVTAVAGWGQQTVGGLNYTTASKAVCTSIGIFTNVCADAPTLRHDGIMTQDGDGTVVSPSATANTQNIFFFDTQEADNQHLGKFSHQNLTSASPILNTIENLLNVKSPPLGDFIKNIKPTNGANPLKVVSSHSPANLLITDASGNQSGIVPILGTDFSGIVSNISGSSVQVFGDENYVFLPTQGTYQVTATGYDTGPLALEIGTVNSGGSISVDKSFTQIPIIAGSKVSVAFNANTGDISTLSIDESGTGQTDATLNLGTATTIAYHSLTPPPTSNSIFSTTGSSNGSISIPTTTPILSQTPPLPILEGIISSQKPITIKTPVTAAELIRTNSTSYDQLAHEPKEPQKTDFSAIQQASAYTALPQGVLISLWESLYHWLQELWNWIQQILRMLI